MANTRGVTVSTPGMYPLADRRYTLGMRPATYPSGYEAIEHSRRFRTVARREDIDAPSSKT